MKVNPEMLERWEKYSELYCRDFGKTCDDVKTGLQAWNIAHALGIPKEAYHVDDSINDAHIETALGRIFKNAIF